MKLDEMKKSVLQAVQEMSPITIPELAEMTGFTYDQTKRIVSTLHAMGFLCKATAIKNELGELTLSWKIPQGKTDQIRDFLYRKE